ncbi:hypothetical protein NEHOM01_1310 [Nematocida homosporus]|uniref:uncharacterized protein n=1 Tax=Nematocida homosporus TaxID=1912981 RepID=UPI00221F8968|nr:uncharacterized protein NEHOM01_1310 [Nematocida homosporus]KAI5186145.1 hypothetical protein NEHOM01_1310 [Nematocida homosporus]
MPTEKLSKRKLKKVRGKNEPKKPTTEYFMFLKDERKHLEPGLSVKDQTLILSRRWAELDQDKKQRYSAMYKSELEKYKQEIAEYKKTDEYKEVMEQNEQLKRNMKQETKGKVTRKPSGYNLFVREERAKMSKGKEDGSASEPMSFKEISQIISKKWHNLSEEEKEVFKTKAREASDENWEAAENFE